MRCGLLPSFETPALRAPNTKVRNSEIAIDSASFSLSRVRGRVGKGPRRRGNYRGCAGWKLSIPPPYLPPQAGEGHCRSRGAVFIHWVGHAGGQLRMRFEPEQSNPARAADTPLRSR